MVHSRHLYRIVHTTTQQSRTKSILLLQQTFPHNSINNNNKMMHISTICKCSHLLFLSIGGVQAFVNSFHPPRGDNIIGRANKNNIKLGESSGPDALLDLDKKSSPVTQEEDNVSSSTSTALDDIPRWDPSTVAKETVVLANDAEFIKSLPDKRQYRAITLPNQLTVLLASDPTTDVEAASVHVRAGHFDDPADRAGLAHFHEHSK